MKSMLEYLRRDIKDLNTVVDTLVQKLEKLQNDIESSNTKVEKFIDNYELNERVQNYKDNPLRWY